MSEHVFTEEEKEEFGLQLEEWKDQYFGAVYTTEIKDVVYIWRGLTKAEFGKANEYYEDNYDRSDYVCRQCVLSPIIEDWSTEVDGATPDTLTEEILKESGFTLTEVELDQKIAGFEQDMNRFDNQIVCIIKEVFQDIPLEDIEDWQFDKILWYYARAIWTLKTLRNIELTKVED